MPRSSVEPDLSAIPSALPPKSGTPSSAARVGKPSSTASNTAPWSTPMTTGWAAARGALRVDAAASTSGGGNELSHGGTSLDVTRDRAPAVPADAEGFRLGTPS